MIPTVDAATSMDQPESDKPEMGRPSQSHDEGLRRPALPPSGIRAALFVDLDGTLIRTDLLHEVALMLFSQSPWRFFRALPALVGGRGGFARAIREAVVPNFQRLPYREEVLAFVSEQRSRGQEVVLTTGADPAWAQGIADELGLFDGVLAAEGEGPFQGVERLEAIRAYCREHGYTEFDYLGGNRADLPIWRAAASASLVAPRIGFCEKSATFPSRH